MVENTSKYYVVGNPYNVKQRMVDSGMPGASVIPTEWYEYEISLLSQDGEVVASWDSLYETYNGENPLTEIEAECAIAEIKRDIEELGLEPSKDWFTIR